MVENYAALIHHPVPKVGFHIPPHQATLVGWGKPHKNNGRERAKGMKANPVASAID